MTAKKSSLYNQPQATEGLAFNEAFRHRKIVQELFNHFHSWGYLPVETPVFDFFDVYRSSLPQSDADRIYRLIDREGELLLLRNDITLFLARQMGLRLSDETLPVRVCYADTILRHQHKEDISRNEFFQAGVELIGRPGFEGDMEILLLLVRTIQFLQLPVRIHLGSRALFNAFFASYTEKARKALGEAVRLREEQSFLRIMEAEQADPQALDTARQLFFFIGNIADFEALRAEREPSLNPECRDELKYLHSLAAALKEVELHDYFTIDFSEIGTQTYHTGIVFQVYMEGADSAVISGGRYDELLERFGFKAPSVGFSLLIRKLEAGIGHPERFELPEPIASAEAETLLDAYRKAEEARKQGRMMTL